MLQYEDMKGGGCVGPLILNPYTRWRCSVSLTLRPLYPPVKECPVPTEVPTAALNVLEKKKISCDCQELTVCTTLVQLHTLTGTLFYLTTHMHFSLEAVLPEGRQCSAYCCSNLPQVGVQVLQLECTPVNIMFLLAIFKEGAGNVFFQLLLSSH